MRRAREPTQMRGFSAIPRRGLVSIDVRPRRGESVEQRVCSICDRVELVSQPDPEAFMGWQANGAWVTCPACSQPRGAA